jgi:hypothetical protein
VPRRPLEREGLYLDRGRRTTQLLRDSLGDTMSSSRVLQSVAHNLAEHAASGLSFFVPHLFRAAKSSAQLTISLDLLADPIVPPTLQVDDPLRLSADALSKRFEAILTAEGFGRDALGSANLVFRFEAQWPVTPATVRAKARAGYRETDADPAFHCRAALVAVNGHSYEYEHASWHFKDQ